jgi:hypothetical protein
MKKNMGTIDITIRLVIAVLLIVLYFTQTITGIVGIILLGLAGIFIATSLFGVCPLYLPFGLSTRSKK